MRSTTSDDDWEWIDTRRLGDQGPRPIRGACLHRTRVPVESVVDGEVLAQLCTVCSEQLPVGWAP